MLYGLLDGARKFGCPRLVEKSAPLLCRTIPVSGTTSPVPNASYRLFINEHALPFSSITLT